MCEDFHSLAKCTIGVLLVSVLLYGYFNIVDTSVTNNKIDTAIEEDWEFYLDGVLVEHDTINMSSYKVTFDDENKYVILSPKRQYRSRSYYPVIIH